MIRKFRLFLALAATLLWHSVLLAQLAPALTPHPAPQPKLPKIDRKACPFEGCQFGRWQALEDVQLFSTWTSARKPTRLLHKGEAVTALTGIHITFEPSRIEVTAPIPEYGLQPGDIVFGYMNLGEGVFNAWFKGQWLEDFDGSGVSAPDGSGCSRKCTMKLLSAGRTEWWVELKLPDGTIGWTREGDKFSGSDALAGPE